MKINFAHIYVAIFVLVLLLAWLFDSTSIYTRSKKDPNYPYSRTCPSFNLSEDER